MFQRGRNGNQFLVPDAANLSIFVGPGRLVRRGVLSTSVAARIISLMPGVKQSRGFMQTHAPPP